jgi:Bifunctional DNA primase/polymerase, N-terminal/Primase C terminal 2 (PriCT-2)/Protein of unknown function (DUF3987)
LGVSSVSNIIHFDKATMLKAALDYARIGWHVFPTYGIKELDDGSHQCRCGDVSCKSAGKHPFERFAPQGHHSATTDEATIRKWFSSESDLNISISLEHSNLVAVDIDPRNGGLMTMEALEAKHGDLVSDVLQLTAGGGEHRVFSMPKNMGHLPGKLGAGVDLKANGYIVAWPSFGVSGLQYEWEASSDPMDGAIPSPLPDWIRDLAFERVEPTHQPGSRFATQEQIEELKSALTFLSADDYHQWVNFGNALKSLGASGYQIWDEWSRRSDKYDGNQMGHKWRSFKPGLFNIESIFHEAQATGWTNPLSLSAQPKVSPDTINPFVQKEIPANFSERLPGVLGIVTDWINATSRKPQPDFAIQAALAFGSTVLGRRYVTTQRNWPSLYFMNIGKSASGKEHAKWAIEQLLEACNLSQLIGPSGYTSDSGVLSTLHHQPCHISVIDEFGKTLEGASIKHGARAASTMKALMEVWGRCDGTIRPQGYSTFGMTAADAQKLSEKSVRNPALTLMAMTTPETFYESVGSAAARDGFLNRFLMVESDIGRQAGQHVDSLEIPEAIIEWASWAHSTFQISDISPIPTPILVPFDPSALALFRAFEEECIKLMDDHDEAGLAEMFGRCNEIAMRVSLILACGCQSPSIGKDHSQLAINYVRHHFKRIVHKLKTVVADSEFEGLLKQVLEMIREAGERGVTERELNQKSRKFRAIDKRQKINVLDTLVFNGDISKCEFPPASGRGGNRVAWVAIDGDKTET